MSTPYAPTNLTATAFTASTINLTWHNPQAFDDVIFIERKPDGGAYAVIATISGTDETYSDHTCGDGTLYYYKIRGRNDLGGSYAYSPYSDEVSATTPLPHPTLLTGIADSTSQITLTWVDNSDNETGFEIYWHKEGSAYALLTTTAADVETYEKTGLAESILYYFKVRAVNAAKNSIYSNEISLDTSGGGGGGSVGLSNTGHQDILIIGRVSAEVTKHIDITVITTITETDVLTRKFEIIATDAATHKVDATHADNGYPISSYIRTKDLDFTDQHPDLAGITKTVKKFRLIYEDVDADMPTTVYISNDGGANWGTCVATLGTGDGTVKFADFYFMDSEYVTGLNFTFKVESLSTTLNFQWLAFELEFMARGESFNV